MPQRLHCHLRAGLLALAASSAAPTLAPFVMSSVALLAGCAAAPAEPVPFKAVPAARIVQPGYTERGDGLVAVDVRRERSRDVIVRFRDALVYIDGEQVTDLMNGEHVVFYLSPGVHRIGVSTQFDPVVELPFTVTADTRYTNRASIVFNEEHRIALRRVAR
ncbi:hypothetical protein [Paraburkholderia sp. BL21I4N1]|uniref:hypothetical protein n=1 Tax=Paraburkholderia sp. BL21I4N1 TaxID=1938801 RepID=UPI000CFA87BE|nr:hypothetical protein [Paraburkholderia sp. BL21I4N1]PQV46168.1 hypothetical protein B0G83_114127 [Paraburkholderia sp. BL21I4N1]